METIKIKVKETITSTRDVEVVLPHYYRDTEKHVSGIYRISRNEKGELRKSRIVINNEHGFVMFTEFSFREKEDETIPATREEYDNAMGLLIEFIEKKVLELQDERLSNIGIREVESTLAE